MPYIELYHVGYNVNPMAKAIILMGVSGSGKTSVGKALSAVLNWPFYDGDDYHPKENIHKMSLGNPLDDRDRLPWLITLNQLIDQNLQEGQSLILACSALKKSYRKILRGNLSKEDLMVVHLRGSFDLIQLRMQKRDKHYMKAEMLNSQFSILQIPKDALVVEINKSVDEIVGEILAQLNLNQTQK